ncbi:Integrin alpha-L CD11 antigen-like family member A [Larimichthys crocea]|uniref:Integrin alpha-L CD11 antigen-like family member A n=1 Tax=Larimichthys crocea TaxID=215358 RepID=A0A6G0JBP2_LARCR|nr:Integrin alpha-L CD11 antigen-like family member A [Larimichthys crocea]
MHCIGWLTYTMAVAICISLAFNIDTNPSNINTIDQKDFFANKVLRIKSIKNTGILSTEAQQPNEELCKSNLNQTHQCLIMPDISLTNKRTPVKHFGLSIAEDSTLSLFTVCSPSVVHECYDNSYLNSVCYKMTAPLQPDSSVTPNFQDITKQTVDLVFLFDGSGSMTQEEFHKSKDFIVDIMKNLSSSSIKFAAVQFSSDYSKVFDFNDYQAGTALDKLMKEPHMMKLTNTHRALKFVLEQIFENPEAGATPNATKVLVIITDGDPSDADRHGIIKKYDEKDIIRFVIGVKDAALYRLRLFASEPKDKHVFKIENYEGLTGILEDHIKQIFKLKALVEDITTEMSQSGLSAVFHKVCSPSVAHECYDNSYLNSVCYKMTAPLQPDSSITPNFQECKKQTVDLAFLFDGSGSMTEEEFHKNKDFIVDIMKNLSSSSIKFAAVQFSSDYSKVFDFNDYQAGTALDKLMKEPHMKKLTMTHKALTFVLEQIFENPGAGATPNATKVLVIITDGDPSDADRHGIIKKYDEKDIIRFVVGVKDAALYRFRLFASEPKDKHVFKIENYDGLTGILEDLIKHISKLKDGKVALTNEMSQSGFSAVFHKDTLILGSVGSNSGRRFIQKILEEKQKQLKRNYPDMQMDYMGYFTSVGEKDSVRLYFTGAPRFGQVTLFRHNCENWIAAQRINGEQPGSHFGAELCPVDINLDGNTDFLLVGAPRFSCPKRRREGHIYIYRLTDEMLLESVLNITAPSVGRFGSAIASLADLNGDGLRDVAVGAPLEDDNSGAVYIFLGDGHSGIRSTFSQRIMGQKIKPELRFFGYTIDGDIDLGENGLPDIVVRSLGTAVVLSSRPVFKVKPHLSFQPERISTERIENLPMVTLTVCFEMVETTNRKQGSTSSGLIISYTLNVDPMKQTHRGFFSQTDEKAWNLTSTCKLSDKDTCFNHSIYMPNFVDDTVSPVSISLNFFQVDSESASAVLNMD